MRKLIRSTGICDHRDVYVDVYRRAILAQRSHGECFARGDLARSVLRHGMGLARYSYSLMGCHDRSTL